MYVWNMYQSPPPPPTPPSSDYFIPKIKILHNDVFPALSGLDSQKAYDPDGVPPVVLKNCASKLASCLVKDFHLSLKFHLFFFLEVFFFFLYH